MTWQDDPYEWIDPEKGRQGGVLAPKAKLTSSHYAGASLLRRQAIDALYAYAKRHGRGPTVAILATYDAKRLSDVPDDRLPAVLEAFSR